MHIHTVYDCKLSLNKIKVMSVYVKLSNINYYIVLIH